MSPRRASLLLSLFVPLFVASSPAGMMIVSHDRAFLQRCVTSVLELDGVTGAASEFAGGYDAYVRERRTAREAEWASYERYQGERKRLLDAARRRKTWAAFLRKIGSPTAMTSSIR